MIQAKWVAEIFPTRRFPHRFPRNHCLWFPTHGWWKSSPADSEETHFLWFPTHGWIWLWCSTKAIDPIKSRRMIRKTAQCSGTALGWRITRSVQKCPESVIPGPFSRLEGTSQNDDPSYPWQEIAGNRTTKRWGSMVILNLWCSLCWGRMLFWAIPVTACSRRQTRIVRGVRVGLTRSPPAGFRSFELFQAIDRELHPGPPPAAASPCCCARHVVTQLAVLNNGSWPDELELRRDSSTQKINRHSPGRVTNTRIKLPVGKIHKDALVNALRILEFQDEQGNSFVKGRRRVHEWIGRRHHIRHIRSRKPARGRILRSRGSVILLQEFQRLYGIACCLAVRLQWGYWSLVGRGSSKELSAALLHSRSCSEEIPRDRRGVAGGEFSSATLELIWLRHCLEARSSGGSRERKPWRLHKTSSKPREQWDRYSIVLRIWYQEILR